MSTASDQFVSNSSDPVVVSVSSSPMSDGSDSPLLVRRATSSSHHSQDQQLQTLVSLGDTEPVVVVGAGEQQQALILVLDKSGSMGPKTRQVLESVSERTNAANNAGISVIMLIFSDDVNVYEFEAGQCPPLTRELYSPDGSTALFDAIIQAIQIVASMPSERQVLIVVESDGEDNVSKSSIGDVREKYDALLKSHHAVSMLMCSSGPKARTVATHIGLSPDQVIALDEHRRDCGAVALTNAQRDYFSSEPGSAAAFSRDDIMSSEPPQPWQFCGSSTHSYGGHSPFADDCVPTPKGPNVSHWNGSGSGSYFDEYGGASDYVPSAYD